MRNQLSTIIFLAALIASCQHQEKQSYTSVDGTWESIGSGLILEIIDSTTYAFYDLTSISCLPSRQGKFEEIGESLSLENKSLSLLIGVITYRFNRIEKLPELCKVILEEKKAKNPIYNFEVFAETVKEHYAFLELNDIDWNNLYKQQKEKLTINSSDAELYLVLEDTFEKLNDNHAFLEATEEVYVELEKLEQQEEGIEEEELLEYGDFQIAQMVAEHHLQEDLTEDSWLIQWGKMTNDIGFIQIKAMWLYGDLEIPKALKDEVGFVDAYVETFHKMYEGDYIEKEVHGVNVIMEKVMNDLSDTKSIVIDVRFNGGGQDAVSFEILSHFISRRQQVTTQKFRYGNKHTPVLSLYIDGIENAYTKPIYVLTSPQTGSAAESFSLSTMAMDHVKRIGSSTTGALSTTLEKTLPNGWPFAVSNEVYMDNNGDSYENRGVPSDYELNYPRDRQTFFRSVANDLEKDKQSILRAINDFN